MSGLPRSCLHCSSQASAEHPLSFGLGSCHQPTHRTCAGALRARDWLEQTAVCARHGLLGVFPTDEKDVLYPNYIQHAARLAASVSLSPAIQQTRADRILVRHFRRRQHWVEANFENSRESTRVSRPAPHGAGARDWCGEPRLGVDADGSRARLCDQHRPTASRSSCITLGPMPSRTGAGCRDHSRRTPCPGTSL